ncbi:MAG: RnfABCDGE type electron transport complex subunit D [Vampirovibrio sp.]|nr:RnfABCDGE type electron transport complex subunit D [Vampirovibrio sp.]
MNLNTQPHTADLPTWQPGILQDARHYQILILTLLLCLGNTWFQFDIATGQVLAVLAAACLTQFLFSLPLKNVSFDPRSPLITSLSLCLLLKTAVLWIAVLAAVVAIASKFIFRWNHRHLFNPANLGIVAAILLTGQAWVSPGQWGGGLWFGFLLTCLAGLVLFRSHSTDMALKFIVIYAVGLIARATWLGDPLAIPLHQLQNGALLIFTFFMISDPKTIPVSPQGRTLFATLVTLIALAFQFLAFNPTGLMYALAIAAITVPFIDKFIPSSHQTSKSKGKPDTVLYPLSTQSQAKPLPS